MSSGRLASFKQLTSDLCRNRKTPYGQGDCFTNSLNLMRMFRSLIIPISMLASFGLSSAALAEQSESVAEQSQTVLITQAAEDEPTEKTEDDEKNWRTYIDLYGFLPLETTTEIRVMGNTNSQTQNLEDVLTPITGAFTGRVGVEYGRYGFQAHVNHGSSWISETVGSWSGDNALRDQVDNDLPGIVKDRRVTAKGKIDLDTTFNQTVVDLAARFRAGAIAKPRMEAGDVSFVGLIGARIVDATMDVDVEFENDVEYKSTSNRPGVLIPKEAKAKFERDWDESWSNTWVSPLIGMQTTYAFSDQWQAFLYLDAAGFGVSGRRDLSGTAQAGISYTLGNSTQLSLGYKYWGLDFAGHGSDDHYDVTQHGVNLGLRLFFD